MHYYYFFTTKIIKNKVMYVYTCCTHTVHVVINKIKTNRNNFLTAWYTYTWVHTHIFLKYPPRLKNIKSDKYIFSQKNNNLKLHVGTTVGNSIFYFIFFKVTYVVHTCTHTQHTTLYYPTHDVARQIAARALANKAPTAPICFQSARIPSNSIGYSKSVLLTRWQACSMDAVSSFSFVRFASFVWTTRCRCEILAFRRF